MKTESLFRFRGLQAVTLSLVTAISFLGFFWPFLSNSNRSYLFFWLATAISFILLLTIIGQAKFDAKSLALLAVLSAIIAALRPLGAGAAGIEPMWFLLILSSYVFGSSFGYLLGAISMLLSAFLTGGFGPWLPYQIFAAALVGSIAGALPKFKSNHQFVKRLQIFMLIIASILLAEIFGILMDLQFWPFAFGPKTQLSFQPGAAIATNLHHFFIYHLSSSMAWNVPRGVFTAILITLVGPGVLNALRRSSRKASFESEIRFT